MPSRISTMEATPGRFSRRDFLRLSGAGLAGATLLGAGAAAGPAAEVAVARRSTRSGSRT